MTLQIEPDLMHGMWYTFNEPQNVIAHPTAGSHVCEPEACTFSRGLYKGKALGSYVFEGKPVNDTRQLSLSDNVRNYPEWAEAMRNCRFFISPEMIGRATLEPDQED